MKKKFTYFVAAVCAALTFSACSSDKLEAYSGQTLENPESPSNAISFGTYMGRQTTTRTYLGSYTGGPISNKTADGTVNLTAVGFGVFGYNSATENINTWGSWDATTNSINKAPNFMYNEKLTHNGSQWVYSPVKYWPNGVDAANVANNPSNTATQQNPQYLSFFAYAPYVDATTTAYSGSGSELTDAGVTNAVTTGETYGITAMSKNNEEKDIQVKYVANSSAGENNAVDLLWGLRGKNTYQETDGTDNNEATLGAVYNTDLTKQIVGEKVKFLFKHALARVGGSTNSTTSASGSQQCGLKVVVDVDNNSSSAGTGVSNQTSYFSASEFDNQVTLVTIKEVKIRDKYTYDQEQNSPLGWKSDFATTGWFNIMKGAWTWSAVDYTTNTNGITYSISAKNDQAVDNTTTPFALNDDIKEPTSGVSSSDISAGKWNISGTTGVNIGAAKNVFANENVPALLLIPGTTNSNTLYVTVDYIVRTADSKLATGFTECEQIITNKVVLDGSILNPNKYYTLVMHLGLTSVKFEAVVADWSLTDGSYSESGSETAGSGDIQQSVWLPSNVVNTLTATASSAAVSTNESVTLTVSNASGTVAAANYTVGVYTDATCVTAATLTTDYTYSSGTVTFINANTYYIKVTETATNLTTVVGPITVTAP